MINTFIKNSPKQFSVVPPSFILSLLVQQATHHYQWIAGRGLCLFWYLKDAPYKAKNLNYGF